MLCIWWDWKEIVYYELLPQNQTIDSKYCSWIVRRQQLRRNVQNQLLNNHCGVIFHRDSIRLNVSLIIQQKLLQLG